MSLDDRAVLAVFLCSGAASSGEILVNEPSRGSGISCWRLLPARHKAGI